MTSTSLFDWEWLVLPTSGMMMHPGMPGGWVELILGGMALMVAWAMWAPLRGHGAPGSLSFTALPLVGNWVRRLTRRPWLLVTLRVLVAAVFLLAIGAGLFGTPIPQRNLATTLTWTLWWTGLVIAIFFVGSAWCAICPWDNISTWLVRRKLWGRGSETSSLNLRAPQWLRNVWPALALFTGLTWLELGFGVTVSPYATALLALLMVVLATASQAIFERKAFCQYFCPVGRTIGFYAELSPAALRPVDPEVCATCTTLECYHGTQTVEPCPTHLVMGRITQNTYCTSCSACTQSCPKQNVAWRLRGVGEEVMQAARPHWDEAWFLLGLLALTSFHGLTMIPSWEEWMGTLAQAIGDSGQMLWSFSLGMSAMLLVPIALFWAVAGTTGRLIGPCARPRKVFATLALATLPLAFVYHLAHNLSHLARESRGFTDVLLNPFGTDTLPLSMHEVHLRHMEPLISQDTIFALQALLLIFGFWMAVRILRHRITTLLPTRGPTPAGLAALPMLGFIVVVTLFNLWLLMQPMTMRM